MDAVKKFLFKSGTDFAPANVYIISAISLLFVSLLVLLGFEFFPAGSHAAVNHSANAPVLYKIEPEYDRTLKKVVISLDHKTSSLNLHRSILDSLPEYSEILLLTPGAHLESVGRELSGSALRGRVRIISYDSALHEKASFYFLFPEKEKLQQIDIDRENRPVLGSVWAQDLFEVARMEDGRVSLLTSEIHKYYYSLNPEDSSKVRRDNEYLDRLSSAGVSVRTVPAAFMGGNVLVDKLGGKTIAFVGGDVIIKTRSIWKALKDQAATEREIVRMIKESFNVDKVVVLGNGKIQPSLIYHLDQAALLLPGGVAGVTRIIGGERAAASSAKEIGEAREYLAFIRKRLKGLGYKIVNVDVSAENLLNYQHYTNAVPFVDASTGERKILMPVYAGAQTAIDRRLIATNTATLRKIGYDVIYVPTKAYELNGGIHCLVNALE